MTLRAEFPRTAHAVTGPLTGKSVARDDLRIANPDSFLLEKCGAEPSKPCTQVLTLTIEEKIDGANLGISVDEDGGTLKCQNRSHLVFAESQPQFGGLNRFLDEVRTELLELFYGLSSHPDMENFCTRQIPELPVVQEKKHNPEQAAAAPSKETVPCCDWILFGEWTAVQHTVYYDQLPSPFIVFDVLHVPSGSFLSADLRNKMIAHFCPSLMVVPRVFSGVLCCPVHNKSGTAGNALPNWDAVHQLWHHQPSRFFSPQLTKGADVADSKSKGGRGEGTIAKRPMMEGIVLRVDNQAMGTLVRRCKCVHDEFVSDIEASGHWRKQKLVKNLVVQKPDATE